jgi:hypothetical protein
LQGRLRLLCDLLHVEPTPRLVLVAADWQKDYLPRLDTPEGQGAIEPFVGAADLVFLDNRSCLFDPEGEKDATAWDNAQTYLLSLRRRGKAVMLAHHSNRQGGARGHSKAEDAMNLLLKLTRPEGYTQDQGARFLVEFDKARGVHGAAAAPFVAALTPNGWVVEGQHVVEDSATRKLRDYVLAAEAAGELPKTASQAISGARVNKAAGLRAWGQLLQQGRVRKDAEGRFRWHPEEGF